MNQPTQLIVTRMTPTRYSYRLIRPSDQPFGRPAARTWYAEVDAGMLAVLCKKLGEAVDAAAAAPNVPGISIEPLAAVGRTMYDTLIPRATLQDLRQQLKELKTPILISTNEPHVLWEHIHDAEGDGFLALKFEIGRIFDSEQAINDSEMKVAETRRCLMISNATRDLAGSAREGSDLYAWFTGHGIDCVHLEGRSATTETVVAKLIQEYDIIHYSGHVDSNTYALKLYDGELTPLAIEPLVKGSPLVFLNACLSGREGLAAAFLRAGARAVVASMFKSPDAGSAEFSRKFYELILNGTTLGLAMREARRHVLLKPECAAAWACFVLYGDPCLTLTVRTNELQSALNRIGVGREDFEKDCAKVLQCACDYGRPLHQVGTTHLFAALVGSVNPYLSDRLREQGVPPDKLQSAFQDVFQTVEQEEQRAPAGSSSGETELSENVETILKLARDKAGQNKITEIDLVYGLVKSGGGTVGEILDHLGVDLDRLYPPLAVGPTDEKVVTRPYHSDLPKKIGPLVQQECGDNAWNILLSSAELARRSGEVVVSTMHLLAGLLKDPAGLLAARLQALGLHLTSQNLVRRAHPVPSLGAEVHCSQNTGEILTLAQANAAAGRRLVEEQDLLGAFVQNGGGNSGRLLQQKGLNLRLLISKLFFNDGRLDFSRFDQPCQAILSKSLDFANQKGAEVFRRVHLLYGMLSLPYGIFCARLRRQNRDPEQLANFLHTFLSKRNSTRPIVLHYRTISTGVVSVLCAAEQGAAGMIQQEHLVQAWAEDGGGEGGDLLVSHRVDVPKLASD